MKHGKKLASLLLALVMVLGLATTAFADENDGSITISNATVGADYAVYKVFDLTYSTDDSGAVSAVAYSYTKNGEPDELLTALQAADSPFTLSESTTAGKYNVALKEDMTSADISAFLQAIEKKLPLTQGPKTADGNEVKFENLPYGYYYVTSSLGTVITLDSTTKDATVIDKNQTPGWDPENPTKPDGSGESGKFVADAANGTYEKTSTAAIGDTAYFKINTYAPKYAGDKLVKTYTFTDTLGAGFTYNNDLVVKLGSTTLTKDTHYTVAVDGQKITVTLDPSKIASYPVEAHLSITYSAAVDKDAVYDNVNTVNMSWTVYPNDPDTGKPDTGKDPYDPNDPSDPKNPSFDPDTGTSTPDPKDPKNPDPSKTDTYVFGFKVQKYKESVADENKLDGAKFKLYDAATEGNEIPVVKVSDGVYRVAVEGETGVEIKAGAAKIFGLDAKTYYLEETAAPEGYNILTERKPVEIKADTETADNVDDNGILNSTIDVINNAGTLLPSTGGMGTTLFYVIGGLLVAAAAVLLITKKRMSQAER